MPDSTVTLVVPGNVASEYLDPSDNHMCDVIGLPPADIRPKGRGEHWVYAEVSPTVAWTPRPTCVSGPGCSWCPVRTAPCTGPQ